MKKTENTKIDILNKKLGYKKKKKTKNISIFRKDKNNLVLNKQQLVSTTRVDIKY
jgi:hypothetical protein